MPTGSSQIGNKPAIEKINYNNLETSSSIAVGTPIVLTIAGGSGIDGFSAVLPSTATASKCPALCVGVSVTPTSVVANDFGEAQVWGFCNFAVLVINSRANSSASWSTQASTLFAALSIDTANNAFVTYTPVTGLWTLVTAATTATLTANFAGGGLPMAVLAQSLASQAASASTSSDTRTVITQGVKVFLRCL